MISVLVVEDDPVAADAHRLYVERLSGFAVAGVAHSGRDAMRILESRAAAGEPIDLVLLDLYLPDTHGLDLCRALRATGQRCDVIAVTSARDLGVVRAAVSVGVVQYLLKPFTFSTLRDKLERYAKFQDQLAVKGEAASQHDIDRAFGTLRSSEAHLPKGMSPETLDAVLDTVKGSSTGMSAAMVGERLGMARVTARRYLEYLADNGIVVRRPKYGQVGRPEVQYHWLPADKGRNVRETQ
ncbi:response regulator [Actinopolymorpha alba]|uniref:response regulator n=1 Tax=Actinopolymorpha alba TaxID=533267 RepID=UPI00036AC970|nr:response regulator [Actinopolymorpha alba]